MQVHRAEDHPSDHLPGPACPCCPFHQAALCLAIWAPACDDMQEQSTLNTTLDLYRHPQFCNSAVGLFWHKAGSGDLAISASFFFRYPTAALRSPSRTAEKQAHPSGPIQVGSRMTRHAPRVPGDVVSTSSKLSSVHVCFAAGSVMVAGSTYTGLN